MAILVYMPGIRIGVQGTVVYRFFPLMKDVVMNNTLSKRLCLTAVTYVGGRCIYYFRIR